MEQKRDSNWPLLFLFLCSGATALVYEVVWSKFLAQMLGSTIQAQTVVLAVFMGGLALGNKLAGRWSDGATSPLKWYGYLELAIGIYAFFFPQIYKLADATFVSLGSKVFNQPALLLTVKAALSVSLLLIPTVLMGGTLPVLAAWLQKHSAEAGRNSARFYSMNSLGAVLGSGLAGFYLIRSWGMVATLQATALVNIIIAGTAIALSTKAWSTVTQESSDAVDTTTSAGSTNLRWAGALVALTGGVSMGLEVLASRSLALIFGSSLQSFAIVLMAFILGIGLGGAAVASPRFRRLNSQRAVAVLLLISAAWIGLLVSRIEWWVEVYRTLRSGLAPSLAGYNYHQLMTGFVAMVILGFPAATIGAVLPLLIRSAAAQSPGLGREVGRLLTWNTFGAVVGVLLTGFVFMPVFGLRGAFCTLAALLGVVGFAAAWKQQASSVLVKGWSAAGLAVVVLLIATGSNDWRFALNSGVFRQREVDVDHSLLAERKKTTEVIFYEDAPDATVSVDLVPPFPGETQSILGLRINGKTDASNRGDMSTQLLCAHLPMAARPQSKDIFLLGVGSGITAGAVVAHPINQLVLAENCGPVIRAAHLFAPWNRGVLTNPLVRLVPEDARTVLKLNPQKYDIIIAEPSNPWTVGVGSVFSKEFYEIAASRLKEGGIIVQWFHTYEMHDGIVGMVLRTFGSVFPHMEVWDALSGDILMLGSFKPWEATPEAYSAIFQRPEVRADLANIGIHSPAALFARQLASQQTAFAIAGDGPIQSDLFPLLEYEAPRAFFLGRNARMLGDFDERTWQQEFAPAAKRKALDSLPDDQIRSAFTTYHSVNPDLQNHLRWRFAENRQAAPSVSPCIFVKTPSPDLFKPSPEASADARAAQAATLQLQTWDQDPRAPLQQLEQLIQRRAPGADWPLPHYAGIAIRASVRVGDIPRARNLLKIALQSAPEASTLQYLARVLSRLEQTPRGGLAAADEQGPAR